MRISLRVDPPQIVPWLSDEKRDANVVLLDFDADMVDDRTLRIDLDVVFDPKPIRRGTLKRCDYYVGGTGAEVTIKASGGTIRDHTQEAKLDVHYSNTSKRVRKVGLSLTPSIKAKEGTSELQAGIGTINRDATTAAAFTAQFASAERYLATRLLGDTIKWSVNQPRGEKVIRDFLCGNLYLFAKCAWANSPKSGVISIRPSDIRFFDSDRRPIGRIKSLMMLFVLWHRRRQFENLDGFSVRFEEVAP